jgi:hypothetical protein
LAHPVLKVDAAARAVLYVEQPAPLQAVSLTRVVPDILTVVAGPGRGRAYALRMQTGEVREP